ncbi:MFS transporter [Streptomyces sp. NPDC046332]|uniref:MFS transporter n=1 Tax=Streptomyces sp. NPDC046332 TaxID=3155133 RepID=UPI0033DC9559
MTPPTSGFRAYVLLWTGQFAALATSSVSSFALGVYCFLQSGSVTSLAVLYALPFVPFLLVAPLAGPLVDRWGAKRAMLVSTTGSMLVALLMTVLLWTDTFAVWQVYFIVLVTATLRALDLPAFEAALPLLVPPDQIPRATGMRMLATGVSAVVGPVLAGALLMMIDIEGIVALNWLSFLLALGTLALVRIPRLPVLETASGGARPSLLADARAGWHYLKARPGLVSLTALLGLMSFGVGFGELVLPPLVLAFDGADGLGLVMSVGALGMVVVSGAFSIWNWPPPRHRITGLLVALFLFSASVVLASLRPSVTLLAAAVFLFMGCATFIVGTVQTVWQAKVEPQMLGRTTALRNAVSMTPQLVGNLLAGALCDWVAVPLVGRDRVRSETVSLLVGDGPGRGYALSLTALGVVTALTVALLARSGRLRHLEQELPDVTGPEHQELDGVTAAR